MLYGPKILMMTLNFPSTTNTNQGTRPHLSLESPTRKPEKYYKILIGDSEEQGGLSWIVKPAKKASNGPEQWNNLFVSAKGENIRVELNGEKVGRHSTLSEKINE